MDVDTFLRAYEAAAPARRTSFIILRTKHDGDMVEGFPPRRVANELLGILGKGPKMNNERRFAVQGVRASSCGTALKT